MKETCLKSCLAGIHFDVIVGVERGELELAARRRLESVRLDAEPRDARTEQLLQHTTDASPLPCAALAIQQQVRKVTRSDLEGRHKDTRSARREIWTRRKLATETCANGDADRGLKW